MSKLLRLLSLMFAVTVLGCGSDRDAEARRKASEHRKTALAAVDKRDWDTAIRECTEAIRLEPKVEDAWWLRGLAHFKKKDYQKAVDDCSEAIKLDAKFDPPYRERGWAYLELKKYKEAIDDLTTFIRLRPDDPEGYQLRASAYQGNGDEAAAKSDRDRAAKLKSKKK